MNTASIIILSFVLYAVAYRILSGVFGSGDLEVR
jgi:hypothetical protein